MYINKVHSGLERGKHSGMDKSREAQMEYRRGVAAFFKGQSRKTSLAQQRHGIWKSFPDRGHRKRKSCECIWERFCVYRTARTPVNKAGEWPESRWVNMSLVSGCCWRLCFLLYVRRHPLEVCKEESDRIWPMFLKKEKPTIGAAKKRERKQC